MHNHTITDLPALVQALPQPLATICGRLFHIDQAQGTCVPPAAMRPWIERQFGALERVQRQSVVKVTNLLTLDASLFNPLRALRPGLKGRDGSLDAALSSELAAEDIFREPLAATPADDFGRIRGRYCTTASNVAKYDGRHGVVIFDEPHPLRWGRAQVADYLDVAWRWLRAAQHADPQACYPIITWNCVWKSGASIAHGHMQMSLASGLPYAAVERWRRAAATYREQYGGAYFHDLRALHQALGLLFMEREGVYGYASLTPVKNREVVSMFAQEGDPTGQEVFPATLADAAYETLRGLVDGQGMRSFNLALYAPPIGGPAAGWETFPWCVRIVDRGDPMQRSVDVGAMELFGSNVVSSDPFEVATSLREYFTAEAQSLPCASAVKRKGVR
jgi:hypothetical protein